MIPSLASIHNGLRLCLVQYRNFLLLNDKEVARRCARFAEILQNCVVRQVFVRMCSIVILAYPLTLPIQTLLSVATTRSVFWRTT